MAGGEIAASGDLVVDRVAGLAAIPPEVVVAGDVDDRHPVQALCEAVEGAGQGRVDVAGDQTASNPLVGACAAGYQALSVHP